MNTTAAVQKLVRKIFVEPRRHEGEVAPRLDPNPVRFTVEPAWLDHYLMHRDERATRCAGDS